MLGVFGIVVETPREWLTVVIRMEIILFVVFLISALLATFFTALASVVKHYIVADVLPIVFSIIAEVACLIMLLGAY
ncbi:hypothetical protein PJM52_29350, partial [Mycobacterium kansasii]